MAQRSWAVNVFNIERNSGSLLLEAMSISQIDAQTDFAKTFPNRRALPGVLGFGLVYFWSLFVQSRSEALTEWEFGRIKCLWQNN